ncbi:MAG: alkaline phosphatase D [Akkermansiaceae bacterium]|jgi:alkaline phosphatase D
MENLRNNPSTQSIENGRIFHSKYLSQMFRKLSLITILGLASLEAGIDSNLVGYYSFEAGYTNEITTGGLPNGTAVKSPSTATPGGQVGNAMSLQGADNDHMNLLASFGTGGTLGENFTISAWYRLNHPITSPSGSSRSFVFESSNDHDVSFGIRDLGLKNAGINDGQSYTQTSFLNLADAALPGWHHVIQTYTSAGGTTTISTSLDGSHSGDLTIPTANLSGKGLNFGASRSSTTDRGFDGLIDEVAIWDRHLDTSELATVFALGLNGQALTSSDPTPTAPTISSFTATPDTVPLGGITTLAWNVTGATSVTVVDELNSLPSSGSQAVVIDSPKTFTLVALNDHAVTTRQVTLSVNGPTDPVGPYLGTVKTTEAYFLYRPGQQEIDLRLTAMTPAGAVVTSTDSQSRAANDHVAQFHLTGLTPETTYRYKVEKINADTSTTLFAGDNADHQFTTVSTTRIGKVVTAGFISCANDTSFGVWEEMANHNLDLLCLAGDTPYIDTADLNLIRQKHRHFLQVPTLAALGRNVSTVGTWDDHDFGLNNGNGISTADRKALTREVFTEYRAHDKYGINNEGIYHKVDMGAMEVFLLDPRWFSQTAPSPVDPNQSTCFGSIQWQWMLDSIRNSKAPFKVILQGQIWQDKKNSETDDMFTYYAERDALLDTIKNEKIPGVVLFGGDIHVARYLRHPQRLGYDLHDFIMSPGHKSVIASLNVYHPSIEWSRESANQFLTMTADTSKTVPELTVRSLDADGATNLKIVIPYTDLSPREGNGLAKDLRALWTFDGDAKNASVLGDRIDGTLENGATIDPANGVRGGALNLTRAGGQYLSVPRSFLDDNTPVYTVSTWSKATTLPAHGSTARHFLLESKVNNHAGLPSASTTGYAISVGLRPTSDPQKINLQLNTETLSPKPVGSQAAPGVAAQGGFNFEADRTLFSDWTHLVATFDSTKLRLFLNGSLVIEHPLPIAGPVAENGGLVIGGHRSGTGRNFDGLIDEVAIWNRVLTPAEIRSLYNSGSAVEIPTKVTHLNTNSNSLPDD